MESVIHCVNVKLFVKVVHTSLHSLHKIYLFNNDNNVKYFFQKKKIHKSPIYRKSHFQRQKNMKNFQLSERKYFPCMENNGKFSVCVFLNNFSDIESNKNLLNSFECILFQL